MRAQAWHRQVLPSRMSACRISDFDGISGFSRHQRCEQIVSHVDFTYLAAVRATDWHREVLPHCMMYPRRFGSSLAGDPVSLVVLQVIRLIPVASKALPFCSRSLRPPRFGPHVPKPSCPSSWGKSAWDSLTRFARCAYFDAIPGKNGK